MLSVVVKAVSKLLVVVMTALSLISPNKTESKISDKKENCRASFAAISDLHLKDNFIRQGMLELGLYDMSQATDRLDAVIFNGDITESSYDEMWSCFERAVKKYDIADETIMVLGNHDTRGHDLKDENGELVLDEDGDTIDDPEGVRKTFVEYNKKVSGRDIDKVYYSTDINGYPAIVLGSEGSGTAAVVSQEQVDWFALEMEKASQSGKPIFVFFHQPFNGTHGLPYTWECDKSEDDPQKGGIGDRSDDILEIVKKYKNVFYVSGHIHAGLCLEEEGNCYASVEKYDGYTLINLPCYMYIDVIRHGHVANGTGYIFEIYDDEVLLRARNFATGTYLEKYDVAIDVTLDVR